MAANDKWPAYLKPVTTGESASAGGSENLQTTGGGGGLGVDTETQRYVDKSMEAVKAQNDARFSRVESQLSKLDELKFPSIWQMMSVAAGAVVALGGLIAIMADRFDGGLAARGLLDPILMVQEERDAAQDRKLDEILRALIQIREQAQSDTDS